MRLARVLLLALAAAIVVIIAVIAVLPRELDWNRYRGSFEVLAGDALGRPVTIAGPIKLSLLPEPVLTASRVAVGGGSGAEITVAQLRLQVALMPLLSGEVDARALTLKNPVLHLAWPPPRSAEWTIPPWLGTLSAEIDDGTVVAGNFKLTHINATLSAGRADAALLLAGSATAGGAPWQIDANLGEPGPGGTQALKASITGTGAAAGTTARFTGSVDPSGQAKGHVTLASANLSHLLAAPALPLHANATLAFRAGRAGLTKLVVTLGSASARGAGVFRLIPTPRLDLALASTGNIPLDRWFAALRGGGQSRLPIALSLSSPRAELAHGLLQNMTLAMVLDPNGARIGAFRAILPGEAKFSLDGRIDRAGTKGAGWEFVGTARLAAPRPATTLHWLDAAAPHLLPPLPPGAVREAKLAARVQANAGQVALNDINGTIDESRVHGGISFGFAKHATVSAGLSLDRLDLDPWLDAAPRSLGGFAKALGGSSIQLRLAVQQATLGSEVIHGLSLDVAATPSALIVRRLDATSEGTHAIASGTINANGDVTAASLALTAASPALLTHLLPRPLGPALARWSAPFSLAAHAAGPARRLALKISATLGDLRFTANPILDVPAGTWQGALTLRHPDAMKFLAASGLTERTHWLGAGSFSLIAHATSGPAGVAVKDFRLVAGGLAASGHLDVIPGPPIAEVHGEVHANVLPLPLIRASANTPLPLGFFSQWRGTVGFTADQLSGAGRLLLRDVSGRVSDSGKTTTILLDGDPPGGGAIGLSLGLDAGATPPTAALGAALHAVRLKGGLSDTALDLSDGTIDGKIALRAKGYSTAAMLATLEGTVQLTASNGSLSGVNLPGLREAFGARDQAAAKARLGAALSGGISRFKHLSFDAKVAQGRCTIDSAQMQSPAGQITASGSFDLPARSLNLTLRLEPAIAGAPAVTLRLAGSAVKPKRLTETAAALAWLGQREKGGGEVRGSKGAGSRVQETAPR